MATALVAGLLREGTRDDLGIVAFDPSPAAISGFVRQAPGCQVLKSARDVTIRADYLILAVKPQSVLAAAQSMGPVPSTSCLISVVAGWSLDRLGDATGAVRRARVMPNTPALVGQAASAVAFSETVTPADRSFVMELCSRAGWVVEVAESLLNAVTGLSGSGPAYVMTFIEGLIAGGMDEGLSREVATALAMQTVVGTVALVRQSPHSIAELRAQVTSPGGTTLSGLAALEKAGFHDAVRAAVRDATRRAAALSAP